MMNHHILLMSLVTKRLVVITIAILTLVIHTKKAILVIAGRCVAQGRVVEQFAETQAEDPQVVEKFAEQFKIALQGAAHATEE